jgi:hypothetical protein
VHFLLVSTLRISGILIGAGSNSPIIGEKIQLLNVLEDISNPKSEIVHGKHHRRSDHVTFRFYLLFSLIYFREYNFKIEQPSSSEYDISIIRTYTVKGGRSGFKFTKGFNTPFKYNNKKDLFSLINYLF